MPPNESFDFSSLDGVASRVLSLKSRLPKDAVHALAEEVLVRIAARSDSMEGEFKRFGKLDDQIDHLAFALIDEDRDAGLAFIQAVQRAGASVEDVYLVFLSRAARRLGVWWEQDSISLTDVTIGTSRIFAILRALDAGKSRNPALSERFAMFASVPGETHSLGVRMAADLFRREGWSIELEIGISHEELLHRAELNGAEVIGLSASADVSIAALTRLVLALRISRPHARILISGQIVHESPDLIAAMDPDAIASDFETARLEMDRLWSGHGSVR